MQYLMYIDSYIMNWEGMGREGRERTEGERGKEGCGGLRPLMCWIRVTRSLQLPF